MVTVSAMSFDIPFVEGVHNTIHAFLRTSEFGSWDVDSTKQNDAFVLNYRRGQTVPPPMPVYRWFLPKEDYVEELRLGGWDGGDFPLTELTVRLRPVGNQRIKVQLTYRLAGRHAELIQKVRGDTLLTTQAQAEIRAMIAHLKESYGFPDVPEIVSE